jgi:hypothetical protein
MFYRVRIRFSANWEINGLMVAPWWHLKPLYERVTGWQRESDLKALAEKDRGWGQL